LASLIVVVWHLLSVHLHGSSSHSGSLCQQADSESFTAWMVSDLSELVSISSLSGLLSMSWSEATQHPDSFSDCDRFATPAHIVPE
jgi:quinol-cytochrome oxidoreductase complex cytochrome b subunit